MRTVRSASIKNIPEAAAPSISQTYAQRSRTAEKSIACKRFAEVGDLLPRGPNLAGAKEHSARGVIYESIDRLVRSQSEVSIHAASLR